MVTAVTDLWACRGAAGGPAGARRARRDGDYVGVGDVEAVEVRVDGVGSRAKSVFPVRVEPVEIEKQVFKLKNQLAWLAYRSRDVKVVKAASRLLVSLTELLEDLGELGFVDGDPSVLVPLLSRLAVLESEAESLLRVPENAREG